MINYIKPIIVEKFKTVCDYCGCNFFYQQEDITLGFGSYGETYVQCPNCGKRIYSLN